MRSHEVRTGQSLADIAIERYGTVEAVSWLLEDNPLLNRNLAVVPLVGSILVIRDETTDRGAEVLKTLARDQSRMASAPIDQTVQSQFMDPDYTINGYVE